VAVTAAVPIAREIARGLEVDDDAVRARSVIPTALPISPRRISGSRATHRSTCAWFVKKLQCGDASVGIV
jgi:hypothetical protein